MCSSSLTLVSLKRVVLLEPILKVHDYIVVNHLSTPVLFSFLTVFLNKILHKNPINKKDRIALNEERLEVRAET